MIHIALVEDDEMFRQQIAGYVIRYTKENHLDITIDTFPDGKVFLEQYHSHYTAIFLDVEMPYMNGIQVAKKIREINIDVPIMFLTNMAQYAINGYEVSAIDYVIKPVSYLTFVEKIKKAIRYGEKFTDYDITIAQKSGKVRLQTSEITFVEVRGHRLTFHMIHGEEECTGNLSALEKELLPYHFSRCNSCFLINLKFVSGIDKDMVEVSGTKIPISRSKKKGFLLALTGYRGGGK